MLNTYLFPFKLITYFSGLAETISTFSIEGGCAKSLKLLPDQHRDTSRQMGLPPGSSRKMFDVGLLDPI